MKNLLLSFTLLVLLAPSLKGQTTEGTEFWLGYMENLDLFFNDDPTFTIWIDADATTNGSVNVPATGLTIPFTALGGNTTPITLPTAIWYSEGSELIDNKGIQVLTDEPVRVTALHYRVFFTESTLVLPREELGTDHWLSAYLDEQGNANSPTAFVVVSTADSTVVEITPTALTQGLQPPGLPFTVVLDEGQNFQVKSLGDLMGTRVRSLTGEPIAVFSGAQQSNIGDCLQAADSHVWDQAIPVDAWGTDYYFVPYLNQGGDEVRILAAEDNTTVNLDCQLLTTLDAGEWIQVKLSEATIINSDLPISVAHFNSSADCNPSNLGDPNLMMEWPLERRTRKAGFIATNGPAPGVNYFTNHFFNIVARAGEESLVELDGGPITAPFTPFPADPNWVYAQVGVDEGPHLLESDSLFYAYSYGFAQYDAYTHHLGYSEIAPVDFVCLNLLVDGVFCTDSLLTFSVEGNQPIQDYDWDFGDGTIATGPMPTHTYSTAGTYTVTLTVTLNDGTELSETLELDIADCPPDPCSGEPNIEISSTGNPCIEPVTFSFLADSTFSQVFWNLGNGETSTNFSPSGSYPGQGTYEIQFTGFDALNCPYETSFILEVPDCTDPCNALPSLDITATPPYCVGQPIVFSATIDQTPPNFPIAVEWVFSDGQFFVDNNFEVVFSIPGDYSVTLTVEYLNGCVQEETFEFMVEDDCSDPCDDIPPVEIVVEPLPICVDSFAIYSAVTDANLIAFEWTLGNGMISAQEFPITAYDTPGFYDVFFQGNDSNGCIYEAGLLIEVVEDCNNPCGNLPDVNILYEPNPLCADSVATVFAQTSAELVNYAWDFGNGETSDQATSMTVYENPGNYFISLEAEDINGCFYEETVLIFVNDCGPGPCDSLPPVNIVSEGPFCVGEPFDVFLETDALIEQYSWSLHGVVVSNDDSFQLTPDSVGIYEVFFFGVDGNTCAYSDQVVFEVEACEDPCEDPEAVELILDGNFCTDSVLVVSYEFDQPLQAVFWTGPNLVSSNEEEAILNAPLAGQFSIIFEAEDTLGCFYQSVEEYLIEDCAPAEDCGLYFPNIFTPDGDGTNDTFRALYACPPRDFFMQIYNRWGGLVYESRDPAAAWNGQLKGKPLPSDVYVYRVVYTQADGIEPTTEYGDITLIR